VIGLLVGVVAGALPGISFVNAMAMSLPFTYVMSPVNAMLFLGGIYVGGVFGGSISAIMINVPGTPASLPACWDGYPMTKQGKVRRALSIAIIASATGGLCSALVLAFAAAPFATFALRFSQPEFFAATVLGLVSVIAIAKDRPLISLLSMLLGITVGTVGVDPLYGMARFSFGVPALQSGINFVVVMIGLFAISEVIDLIATNRSLRPGQDLGAAGRSACATSGSSRAPSPAAPGIGCMLGVIPGAGATPGAVIAYGVEMQASKRGNEFGTGVEEGLAAPEAAKNATTGSAMVPLLTLGIPGSAATAIMLAAMMLHGVNPGPLLFLSDPSMVYTIFAAMIIANILMIVAGCRRRAVLLDADADPAGGARGLHRGPERARRLRGAEQHLRRLCLPHLRRDRLGDEAHRLPDGAPRARGHPRPARGALLHDVARELRTGLDDLLHAPDQRDDPRHLPRPSPSGR
jgi:putative tricarboxylic transport membrane protein